MRRMIRAGMLAVLLLSLVANAHSSSLSGYKFYFINGMLNNEERAEENFAALEDALRLDSDIELLLNDSRGYGIGDVADIIVQRRSDIANSITTRLELFTAALVGLSNVNNEPYIRMRAAISGSVRNVGYLAEGNYNIMYKDIRDSLLSGQRVIVIAHSEGNYFYKALYDRLNADAALNTDKCFAGVGIGSPLAASPTNYRYVQNSNDTISNIVRSTEGGALSPNITIPEGYNGDVTGHGMIATYAAHSGSRDMIRAHVNHFVQYLGERCPQEPFDIRLTTGASGSDTTPSFRLRNDDARRLQGSLTLTATNLKTGKKLNYYDPSIDVGPGSNELIVDPFYLDVGRNRVAAVVESSGRTIATADTEHEVLRECPGPIEIRENDWSTYSFSRRYDLGGTSGIADVYFQPEGEWHDIRILADNGTSLVNISDWDPDDDGYWFTFRHTPSTRGDWITVKVDDHQWWRGTNWRMVIYCPD